MHANARRARSRSANARPRAWLAATCSATAPTTVATTNTATAPRAWSAATCSATASTTAATTSAVHASASPSRTARAAEDRKGGEVGKREDSRLSAGGPLHIKKKTHNSTT